MKRRITGGWLVRDKQCTASCLIASGSEVDGCTCVCGGVWHGALAGVEIVEQRAGSPKDKERGGQIALIEVETLRPESPNIDAPGNICDDQTAGLGASTPSPA